MIAEALIEEVKKAASIVDVISEFMPLKRTGVNYKGCCPFHNEDTPSFVVSPSKKIYHCFGCGKGGDAVNFVMEYERLSYVAAMRYVAKKYDIHIPERELTPEEAARYKRREEALHTLEKNNAGFKSELQKSKEALAWLTDERGIKPETIEKWGLGFAKTGFLGGRITYPIHNIKGDLAGFTGRLLGWEKGSPQPKFKNSAEDELYKKSELLYGFHHAKMRIQKVNRCYIVEGQHDVMMMHQAGFENTVAPSGTALTVDQIRLIKPWTKNIVLLLDGDKAGLAAAIKHITTLLTEQVNLRIIVLPEKEDPDSFLRNGCFASPEMTREQEAKAYIETNEIDFIEFKAGYYRDETKTDPSRLGELITEITSDISLINDKNVRFVYTQSCAKIFGVKEAELNKDIAKLREKMKVKQEEGTWFAFDEAEEAIKESSKAIVMSNYNDVIDYHMNNNKNYIGMNCATLQKEEILKLKKLTKTVIYDELVPKVYDHKTKEESATVKNLKRLMSFGMDVRMRNDDGGEIDAESGDVSDPEYINFTDWFIRRVTDIVTPADDLFTSWAIEHIAELLSYLPESSRMVKLGNVQAEFKEKKVKLSIGDFKKILTEFLKKNAKSFEPSMESVDMTDNPMNLSMEQLNDLNRYQHYFDKNCIHHVSSKTGHITRISNFVIIPIIHSNTSNGHFKLFEMTNEFSLKVNISLDTKDLNDCRRFKCAVEEKGNFVFKGDQFQLDNIKERLYSNTTYSDEIEQQGWQSEGFWAWAEGITTTDGKFTKTDGNGLISIGEKNYLIKPFSKLYAHDKTAFLNEKKFRHMTSDVTWKDWSSRYVNVFGDNAKMCICALLTALYSDAIFKMVHGELPLINFFGPKGTGKTQQADSLLAFFGEKQPINNLSKVTVYGLAQTMKAFHNAFVLIDEYKNSLDMRFIETLKSFYNRQAKIQGSFASQGAKTEHIPVNSMVLLCGQDLPTLDVALLERCVCLTAYKNEYTDEQVNRYKELKDIEEKGLAHLTDDFLKYRELVIEKFQECNGIVQTMVSKKCKDVSVRLQKNLTTILSGFYILQDKFEFPFTFDEILDFGIDVISEQQKFIESSDDLKNFWSIFATLIEQDKIKEGRNYILHDVCSIRFEGNNDETTYGKGIKMLFVRWDGLYPMYAQYSRMSNMVALGEKTIQFYLEKTKYYQGKLGSKKFRDKQTKQVWVNQAYCFDYANMNVNLIETKEHDIEADNKNMTTTLDPDVIAEIIENEKEADKMEKENIELEKAKEDLPF